MHDTISTTGPQRPRVRRGLGVVVGVAALAAPIAFAPAAQAAAPGDTFGSYVDLLQGIASGLGHTAATPLGEQSPNTVTTCTPGYLDGVSSLGTCVIAPLQAPLDPGKRVKAKVSASMRRGKVASVRWIKR